MSIADAKWLTQEYLGFVNKTDEFIAEKSHLSYEWKVKKEKDIQIENFRRKKANKESLIMIHIIVVAIFLGFRVCS